MKKSNYKILMPLLVAIVLLFINCNTSDEQYNFSPIPEQIIGSWLFVPVDSFRPNGTDELEKVNFCSLDLQRDGQFYYTYTSSKKDHTKSGCFGCGRYFYDVSDKQLKLSPSENFLTDKMAILSLDSSRLVMQFTNGEDNSPIVWNRCQRNEDLSISEDSSHSRIYSFRGDYLMRDSYRSQ